MGRWPWGWWGLLGPPTRTAGETTKTTRDITPESQLHSIADFEHRKLVLPMLALGYPPALSKEQ